MQAPILMRTLTISVSDGAPDGEEVCDVLSITLPSHVVISNQIISELSYAIYQHIIQEHIDGAYPNVLAFASSIQNIFRRLATIDVLWLNTHMTDEYLEEFLEWNLRIELTATIDDTDFYRNTILNDDAFHTEDITEFLGEIGWM